MGGGFKPHAPVPGSAPGGGDHDADGDGESGGGGDQSYGGAQAQLKFCLRLVCLHEIHRNSCIKNKKMQGGY